MERLPVDLLYSGRAASHWPAMNQPAGFVLDLAKVADAAATDLGALATIFLGVGTAQRELQLLGLLAARVEVVAVVVHDVVAADAERHVPAVRGVTPRASVSVLSGEFPGLLLPAASARRFVALQGGTIGNVPLDATCAWLARELRAGDQVYVEFAVAGSPRDSRREPPYFSPAELDWLRSSIAEYLGAHVPFSLETSRTADGVEDCHLAVGRTATGVTVHALTICRYTSARMNEAMLARSFELVASVAGTFRDLEVTGMLFRRR